MLTNDVHTLIMAPIMDLWASAPPLLPNLKHYFRLCWYAHSIILFFIFCEKELDFVYELFFVFRTIYVLRQTRLLWFWKFKIKTWGDGYLSAFVRVRLLTCTHSSSRCTAPGCILYRYNLTDIWARYFRVIRYIHTINK